MRLLLSLPPALAAMITTFVVTASAETFAGFPRGTEGGLNLRYGNRVISQTGGQVPCKDVMDQEPSFNFNGAKSGQSFTAVMVDMEIFMSSQFPSVIITKEDSAWVSLVQPALRAFPNGTALSTQRDPLVPYATSMTPESDQPHLILALLYAEPANYRVPKAAQRQLRRISGCKEQRGGFNLDEFLQLANLRDEFLVAAEYFIVLDSNSGEAAGESAQTTVIVTGTETVTTTLSNIGASTSTVTAPVTGLPPPPPPPASTVAAGAGTGNGAAGVINNGTAALGSSTKTDPSSVVGAATDTAGQAAGSTGVVMTSNQVTPLPTSVALVNPPVAGKLVNKGVISVGPFSTTLSLLPNKTASVLSSASISASASASASAATSAAGARDAGHPTAVAAVLLAATAAFFWAFM